MKSLYLLLFLILCSIEGFSDEYRHRERFRSQNEVYELRVAHNKYKKVQLINGKDYNIIVETTWGLYDLARNKQVYTVKGDFSSKSVLVSNDGKHLVVIDDYSEANPDPKLRVLEFYNNGQLVKAYSLGELLCSYLNIAESVSHFRWMYNYDYTYAPDLNFFYDAKTFTISTFELYTLVFDIKTGAVIMKRLDPLVNQNSILVYGEVKDLGKEEYVIDVCQRVYGIVPKNGKIKFKCNINLGLWGKGDYLTLLINKGQYIKSYSYILNQCAFRKEKQQNNNCLIDRYSK